MRDVSEAKSAEQAQARLEEQLRRAQRLESLGVLAGGIAHDFNNILAAILGYTELTQPLVAAHPEAQENLANVLVGVQRARELVRQILAFSRQATLSPAPTHLEPLIHEALRMLRAALGANIELRIELDPETPPALADPAQIHQVLLNLCTNAAQAMPSGGLLTVGLSAEEVGEASAQAMAGLAPGRYVVLAVADTGCGMDAATRDRIFDPFFTTKAPGEGTGLGLSTSHGIVTSHGGAITVYSEPGHGSTFRVWLPATDEAPETTTHAAPAPPARSLACGGRVLFVDDEPALVSVATSLLRVMGYDARLTRDPAEALAWLRETPDAFDVLITDQTMPNMLGMDLARAAHGLRPDLPIIIASGFSARISPDEAAEAGVVTVLAKPYGHSELGLALARAVGG
ncbi:MAG: response regulator [Armatimonadetes bacterium]|nr:response regulator [Armatimonadota bacterium]